MSTQKINNHHRETHLPVQCDICQKECSTPHSLEWHIYSHNVKPFVCKTCNQGFHFASELASHRIKHREIKTFICAHPKCSKSFMWNSELTGHSNTHTRVKYVYVIVINMKPMINGYLDNIRDLTLMRNGMHVRSVVENSSIPLKYSNT